MKDEKDIYMEELGYNDLFLALYIMSTIFMCYVISVVVQFTLYAWFNNVSMLDNFTLEVIWDRGYSFKFFDRRQPLAELLAMVLSVGYIPFSFLILKLLGLDKRYLPGFISKK